MIIINIFSPFIFINSFLNKYFSFLPLKCIFPYFHTHTKSFCFIIDQNKSNQFKRMQSKSHIYFLTKKQQNILKIILKWSTSCYDIYTSNYVKFSKVQSLSQTFFKWVTVRLFVFSKNFDVFICHPFKKISLFQNKARHIFFFFKNSLSNNSSVNIYRIHCYVFFFSFFQS